MSIFKDAYEGMTKEERVNLHAAFLATGDDRRFSVYHDVKYDAREAAQARGPAAFKAPGRSRHKKGKR
jgi:hypothetical protein